MPREQARGEPGDERSDLYALGVVIYAMLTKRTPFPTEEIAAVLVRQKATTPPPLPPSVPAVLANAVLRLMAHDPAKRYPTAAIAREALVAAAARAPSAEAPSAAALAARSAALMAPPAEE